MLADFSTVFKKGKLAKTLGTLCDVKLHQKLEYVYRDQKRGEGEI